MKLLCLCDSPTIKTGYGRVSSNLIPLWQKSGFFSSIDVWGIGYHGYPFDAGKFPCRIFPASTAGDQNWASDFNLRRFLTLLSTGGYTHLWIMQDPFALARIGVALREVCEKANVFSLLYFPVDAPMDPSWLRIVGAVDVPVAYTQYGAREAAIAAGRDPINHGLQVIPHGTDQFFYRPLPQPKSFWRQKWFSQQDGVPLVKETDFLLLAVSAHQKRKGLAQTLQVFAKLKLGNLCTHSMKERLKLYMHMPSLNQSEQSDLLCLASQLGILDCVIFGDPFFSGNVSALEEEQLVEIYNAADLFITTTLGEGWGLPITEAMACGIPVAGPRHTAVAELIDSARGITFNCISLITLPHDNMRQRPVTDVDDAAAEIADFICAENSQEMLSIITKRALDYVTSPWFAWPAIAQSWLRLMERK